MKKFVAAVSVFMFISVIVGAQEVVLPINQQRTTNAMTLKADPGTATSQAAMTIYSKPGNLAVQDCISLGIANSTAAFCQVGTTSMTFTCNAQSWGGIRTDGTTYYYFTGMQETATIDAAMTYLAALSTATPGLGGGLVVLQKIQSLTGIPSSRLTPSTVTANIGITAKVFTVTPTIPKVVNFANSQSSFTISSYGGLYPGTSVYALRSTQSINTLATFINNISSVTPGVSGGLQAATMITNPGYVQGSLLDSHTTTNITGVSNAQTLNVTPTTATVTYSFYGSSYAFKSTGGLWPGTTAFNSTQGSTIDGAISGLAALPAGTIGIGNGLRPGRVQGYYPQTAVTYLTPVLTFTDCSGAVSTMTSTASQGISYILSRNLLNVGQRWHVTGASGNLTYSNGITSFKVYAGSNTTDTLIAQETTGATTVDKSFVTPGVDGCFVGAPYTDMRIDLICDSTATTAGYLNIRTFKGYETPR